MHVYAYVGGMGICRYVFRWWVVVWVLAAVFLTYICTCICWYEKKQAEALRREAAAKDEMIAQLRVQVRKMERNIYLNGRGWLVGASRSVCVTW